MAKKGEVSSGNMIQLDPAVILADDNTRFGLKESRVASLAKSILDRGEVLEPVEVETIADAKNGHAYRLTTGFYRLAAVTLLNTTQGAGLTIPAIVRPIPTAQERLRRQLAENMERENQSPMDTAVAIKKLMDQGLTKMEVREIFSRPGGRKGAKTQIASNSFINMHLSFLDLKKGIQTMIHEGLIGVAAAYELTRLPADRHEEVITKAKALREKALEQEEKDEERILAQEAKKAEQQKKRDAIQTEVTAAETKHTTAQASFTAATETAKSAYLATQGKFADAKAKKVAQNAFKEAEKNRLAAEADLDLAKKEHEEAQMKFTKHETLAATKAQALKDARAKATTTKKGDAVGPSDVKKAAASAGASTNFVALNASEMRNVVKELALPGSNEIVKAIGESLVRCFAGEITDKELYKTLVGIVS